ncbi:jg574 [Pararge aegeria aegeria]|uniref:Jg574 protein n=1 Tax=Pararge aegeria aegeria TaxID=348720 RepID=A0A8S4QJ95_9NEOP|nr:jg574 [Pararge aegeria aegeria]
MACKLAPYWRSRARSTGASSGSFSRVAARVVRFGFSPPVSLFHRLAYNEVHQLLLNNTVEYILEFTPPADGVESYDTMPSLLWMHSDGGDVAHPVLVTARQRAGKDTPACATPLSYVHSHNKHWQTCL